MSVVGEPPPGWGTPVPGLLVRRSQPEGGAVKSTKGRLSRRVPSANRVLPIIRGLSMSKAPGGLLLMTERGRRPADDKERTPPAPACFCRWDGVSVWWS